jgi:hypothetical protein
LRPFQEGDKWGYKDRAGQVVITPQFDWAESFSDGRTRVRPGNNFVYKESICSKDLGNWYEAFSLCVMVAKIGCVSTHPTIELLPKYPTLSLLPDKYLGFVPSKIDHYLVIPSFHIIISSPLMPSPILRKIRNRITR